MEREARGPCARADWRTGTIGQAQAILFTDGRGGDRECRRDIDPYAASPRDLLRVRRSPRLHSLHWHGGAGRSTSRFTRLPLSDGPVDRRPRRYARPFRRRRDPGLFQRSAADARTGQAFRADGVGDARTFCAATRAVVEAWL